MGTFMGHFLPGSFFLAFSMWWTFAIFNRYYKAKYRKGPAYASSCTFSGSRLQWEGLLKAVLCGVGLVGETVTALDDSWHWAAMGNGQHATMFSFFGLSGIIDMLVHCKGTPLPKGTDYAFATLCFAVEGVLFLFHLHGRTHVDIVVHTLLVYVVWACVLAAIVEAMHPKSPMPALARTFLVALQGTWFIQVGAMLYPPVPGLKRFDAGNQHENTMLATVVFGWHMLAIFLAMTLLAILVHRHHKGEFMPGQGREISMERLIASDASDSETEFDSSVHIKR